MDALKLHAFMLPETFCNDCGVQFESSTSLQVHLTYHKENLINRWGSSSSRQQPSPSPSPKTSLMEPKTELPSPSSSPIYSSSQAQQHFGHYAAPPPFSGAQTIHFLQTQNQFSPNHYEPPRVIKERNPSEPPAAEILDLDSNRVHLYNIQEQNFYRPYLMTAQPPPPPLPPSVTGTNVWPPQAPPTEVYHSPFHPQELYARNSGGPPPQNIIYNYVPTESSAYTQQQNQPPPPPSATFSQPPPPSSSMQQSSEGAIPSPGIIEKINKKQPQSKKSEGGVSMDMRGKGKGGECKRPKSYECTACNKWFTSSGHLKRHYGTTLHKNSVQQNGGEMEPIIGPGRGKGKKKQPKKETKANLSDSNSSGNMDMEINSPPQQQQMSNPLLQNNGNGQLNGRTEEPPPQIQGHFVPPPPNQPPTYLFVGEPQQLIGGNHHQFPHHFDPSLLYNNPHHHPPQPLYHQNNNGYPAMEVPLPPFMSQFVPDSQHVFEQNGNGEHFPNSQEQKAEMIDKSSPEPQAPKEEPNDESPEVGRGGMSPHSSISWLSPDSPSPPSSCYSSQSQSSGNEYELNAELSTTASGETAALLESNSPMKEDVVKVIQCPNCSKTFSRTCYLTQHHNSSHSAGGRPFKCPTCGKRFTEDAALSDHVAKHGSNKPYKCDRCPKQFNHKTDLRRHMCLHTGQKPFNCSECGKGFIRKDHMEKHSETHRSKNQRSNGSSPPTMVE